MPESPRITAEEFLSLAREQIPLTAILGFEVVEIGYGHARLAMPFKKDMLRPGGTIAGPVLMALADAALWAVILGMIGPREQTVTSNFHCNFLRRPAAVDTIAEARILKLDRRLAVADVAIFSAGEDQPVAQASGTYAIPPERLADIAVS